MLYLLLEQTLCSGRTTVKFRSVRIIIIYNVQTCRYRRLQQWYEDYIIIIIIQKNRWPQKRPLSPGRWLKSSIRELFEQRPVDRDYRQTLHLHDFNMRIYTYTIRIYICILYTVLARETTETFGDNFFLLRFVVQHFRTAPVSILLYHYRGIPDIVYIMDKYLSISRNIY